MQTALTDGLRVLGYGFEERPRRPATTYIGTLKPRSHYEEEAGAPSTSTRRERAGVLHADFWLRVEQLTHNTFGLWTLLRTHRALLVVTLGEEVVIEDSLGDRVALVWPEAAR